MSSAGRNTLFNLAGPALILGLSFLSNLAVTRARVGSSATSTIPNVREMFSSSTTPASVALKPDAVDALQYVSNEDSDSQDGRFWGSAKLTQAAACAALPFGNSACSAGEGVIYIAPGFTGTAFSLPSGSGVQVIVLTPAAMRFWTGACSQTRR